MCGNNKLLTPACFGVRYLSVTLQWVASVDLFPNEEAEANVIVTKLESWVDQNEEVGN